MKALIGDHSLLCLKITRVIITTSTTTTKKDSLHVWAVITPAELLLSHDYHNFSPIKHPHISEKRRQINVLFIDVTGSFTLSSLLSSANRALRSSIVLYAPMEKPIIVFLFLLSFLHLSLSQSRVEPVGSQIRVVGSVYCDICSNNTFSTHSYFIPGVEVKIECKLRATAERTTEEITLSVNRRTNKLGMYQMVISGVDGIDCAKERAVVSFCRATLLRNSPSFGKCNVPGLNTTSDVVYFKSSEQNVCIYGLSALNFRPSRVNKALCGK